MLCWQVIAAAQDDTTAAAKDSTQPWRRKPPLVFGYVQIHYRNAYDTGTDTLVDNSNFRVQRVRIGVKGYVYPWLAYDVEIDPRSPTIATVLRDAFFALKVIPRHDIRVGQQKIQFGYENRESSSNLFVVNRSEVSDNLSRGVTLRDIGIGLIGNVKVGPKGFRIEDAVTLVNGAGINVQNDDTPRKNLWGRVGVRWRRDTDGLTARFGISGATGDFIDPGNLPTPSDDIHIDFKRLGTDVEIDHSKFLINAEYVTGDDRDVDSGEKTSTNGYYVTLVAKPWRDFGPLVRYDALGVEDSQRWTYGAWYGVPNARFRVLVNYEYRKLRGGVRADDKFYIWTQFRF
jgi:hypothetical protein